MIDYNKALMCMYMYVLKKHLSILKQSTWMFMYIQSHFCRLHILFVDSVYNPSKLSLTGIGSEWRWCRHWCPGTGSGPAAADGAGTRWSASHPLPPETEQSMFTALLLSFNIARGTCNYTYRIPIRKSFWIPSITCITLNQIFSPITLYHFNEKYCNCTISKVYNIWQNPNFIYSFSWSDSALLLILP